MAKPSDRPISELIKDAKDSHPPRPSFWRWAFPGMFKEELPRKTVPDMPKPPPPPPGRILQGGWKLAMECLDDVATLKAFRGIGETFQYLGLTMAVRKHKELLPVAGELYARRWQASLLCDYVDDCGVIRHTSFVVDDIRGLRAQNGDLPPPEMKELREELEVTDKLLHDHERILATIPECPAHGACVPHAVQWVKDQIAANMWIGDQSTCETPVGARIVWEGNKLIRCSQAQSTCGTSTEAQTDSTHETEDQPNA